MADKQGEHKAKSPYAKYNKKPHVYSELLRNLLSARREGHTERADDLAMRHSRNWLGREGAL